MKAYVDEMDLGNLIFSTPEMEEISLPIVGCFSIQGKYYVVVLVTDEETNEQELLLLSSHKDEDGSEYVQLITDIKEWDTALEAWEAISLKVELGEYDSEVK